MLIFVLGIAALYSVLAVGMFIFQKHLIHVPFKAYVGDPSARGLDYESVTLVPSAEDAKLSGWFVEQPDARFTALVFGGNAGNMSYMLDTVELFADLGLSVFIYDYRSFGSSEGKLTERAMYDDAELAWEYLTQTRQIPPDRIVVFGRSLGGAVASWVATQYQPAALIMESVFTKLEDMGKVHYRWIPTKYLLRFRYDNLSRIDQVRCPILFIHSREDELTPFAHSERLYDAATADKHLLAISGNHASGFLESGTVYTEGIEDFLRRVLK